MTTSEGKKTPVALVTGASGYIAGHVVKQLLEAGWEVRGTVRSLQDPSKTKHLTDLFPSLKLYEADLLTPNSFDEAVRGVDYVFHTASPFQIVVEDPQRDLVDPALNGTKNVLGSIKKNASDTIKRVVVTSSVAAIAGKKPEGHVYTEDDWNLDSTVSSEPYRYSKRVAEEAAWEFAKETGISLVTINPALVIGPPLSSRVDSTSVKIVKSLLDGSLKETGTKPVAFGLVDVRDVAKAHVNAATSPNAKGRYILSSDKGIPQLTVATILRENGFSQYPIPSKEEAPLASAPIQLNNTKVQKELDVQFTPLATSVIDMATALINLGIVPKV